MGLEYLLLTDIFLIRHGHPVQNSTINYHVPPGPDLSERGREEAAQAAAFLADKGIEQLFASPFARTSQTAEVLVDVLGLSATLTRLIEEQAPSEQFPQVRERMREFLSAAQDSPYSRIALVTHGSPVRAALLELSKEQINLSGHFYPGGNPAPTCGIWHVRWLDERSLRFELAFKPT